MASRTRDRPAGIAPDGLGPGGAPGAGRIWLEDDLLRAGYTQCLNVLLPSTVLRPPDKIVFYGVLSFAWQEDTAWPSIEQLAARVGLNRSTVIDALQELKRHGLLRVHRRGQGFVNLYEIPRITHGLLNRIEAAEPDEEGEESGDEEDLVEVEDLTEAKGFTPLSNLILTARRLDATDKLVYVGLKSFAWGRARCRLKMATLARRIGISERTVMSHLGRLRAAGLVTRRRRGLGRANIYTLVRIHPAVLGALQEPRHQALACVDNSWSHLVARCPVCRRTIERPTPVLEAVLTCPSCGPPGAAVDAGDDQNRKAPTSASEVAGLRPRNRKAPTSASRPTAVLEVAGLRCHEEDPDGEDPSEIGGYAPDWPGWHTGEDEVGRLWRATLVELLRLISPASFATWFRASRGLRWDRDVVTIAAANRFAQEWLDVRYRPQVEEALRRVGGRPLALTVVTDPATAPERAPVPAARAGGRSGGGAARRRPPDTSR